MDFILAPDDFASQMVELKFDANTSRACADFTAKEDNIVEGVENLTATLSTDDDGILLLPEEAVIDILESGSTWGGREGGREERERE